MKAMIFGVFDIIHQGHLHLIREAYKHADRVIAILATDKNVKKAKGKPKHNQNQRKRNLSRHVDKAIIGDQDDFLKPLLEEKPDVIVLGYDQKDHLDIIKRYEAHYPSVEVIRASSYKPDIYKSSLLREK